MQVDFCKTEYEVTSMKFLRYFKEIIWHSGEIMGVFRFSKKNLYGIFEESSGKF